MSAVFFLSSPLCVRFQLAKWNGWMERMADVEMKQFKEDGDQSGACGRRSQPPAGRRSSRERVNRRPPQKFRLIHLSIDYIVVTTR